MAGNKYQSKYTGEQVDAILDYANNSKEELKNMSDKLKEDIETAIDNIEVPEIDESNIVHKDGDEEIYGQKTFYDVISILQGIFCDGTLNLLTSWNNNIFIAEEGVEVQVTNPNKQGNGFFVNDKEVALKDDITTAMDNIEIPEVDQSYNAESENAQSGKAIEGALADYVKDEELSEIDQALDNVLQIQEDILSGGDPVHFLTEGDLNNHDVSSTSHQDIRSEIISLKTYIDESIQASVLDSWEVAI